MIAEYGLVQSELWIWGVCIYLLAGLAFAGYTLFEWLEYNSWRRVTKGHVILGLACCVLLWLPVALFNIGCEIIGLFKRNTNGPN